MLYYLKITIFNIILILLLFILSIVCITLLYIIKKLKEEIKELETKKIIDINKSNNIENIIPIKNISNNKKNTTNKDNQKKKIELYQPNYQLKKDNNINNKAYIKNTIKEYKTTSPISINNNEFNAKEFIRKESKNNNDYLKEVSEKIKKEIESKPIELTEYEQEEELNAIISYKELLNSKEKETNIEEKNNNQEEFIEQLKKLRNSL